MKNSRKQSIYGALAISTALAITALAGPSYAADGAKVITSSSDKVKVSITGQINRTVLYYDDDFNDGVRHMDNDYSSTRFRWNADARVNNDIKIGGLIEIAAINNSNASTNQDTEGTGDTASLTDRHLEFWVDHARFGTVYVGKGAPASNGTTTQATFNGDNVGLTSSHFLAAGGLNFKSNGNACSISGNTCVGIGSAFSDFDGLGRQNRLRYNTPVIAGFMGSVSHTDGGAVDAALYYAGKIFGAEVAGGIGYAESSSQATAGVNGDQVSGSLSFTLPMGIGLHGSYAEQDLDARTVGDNPKGFYIGAHYEGKLSEIGTSTFTASYGAVDNLAAAGDDAESFALSVNQEVEAAAFDVYAQYTHYELDRTGVTFGDIDTIMVGGRIKF